MHCGIISIVVSLTVFLPSIMTARLTYWTVFSPMIVVGLSLAFAYFVIPASELFWNSLFAIALVCSLLAAARVKGVRSLSEPFEMSLANRPLLFSDSAGSEQRIRRRRFGAMISASCLGVSIFWLIPNAAGRWRGNALSEFWKADIAYCLLTMKNPNSYLHKELVQVYLQGDEYILVQLAEGVPHPNLEPTTQSADTMFASLGYSPTLVPKSEVESVTLVISASMFKKSFEEVFAKNGLGPNGEFKIERTVGGGYTFKFVFRPKKEPKIIPIGLEPTTKPSEARSLTN